MTESLNKIREQLLAQNEPTRERRLKYEQETQAMLQQIEAGFRKEKWGTGILWIYATIFMTAALIITGYRNQVQPEISILAFAFTLLIVGAVELVKHFINRSRIEVLKELKAMQMQFFELESRMLEKAKEE
jgi:hypothetical protein